MAAATKARTEGDKRRAKAAQKALHGVCAITGVRIAAEQDKPVLAEKEAKEPNPALLARCADFGWLTYTVEIAELTAEMAALDKAGNNAARLASLGATRRRLIDVRDANIARARDQKAEKLYGKLYLAARFPDGMTLEAYEGIEAMETLDLDYRHGYLNSLRVRMADGNATDPELKDERIAALVRNWQDAMAVVAGFPSDCRVLLKWIIRPEKTVGLSVNAVNREQERALRIMGNALARHFGLRS